MKRPPGWTGAARFIATFYLQNLCAFEQTIRIMINDYWICFIILLGYMWRKWQNGHVHSPNGWVYKLPNLASWKESIFPPPLCPPRHYQQQSYQWLCLSAAMVRLIAAAMIKEDGRHGQNPFWGFATGRKWIGLRRAGGLWRQGIFERSFRTWWCWKFFIIFFLIF